MRPGGYAHLDDTSFKDVQALCAAFFAANLANMLDPPSRLEALAQLAGIPPERVPTLRATLARLSREGLSS